MGQLFSQVLQSSIGTVSVAKSVVVLACPAESAHVYGHHCSLIAIHMWPVKLSVTGQKGNRVPSVAMPTQHSSYSLLQSQLHTSHIVQKLVRWWHGNKQLMKAQLDQG